MTRIKIDKNAVAEAYLEECRAQGKWLSLANFGKCPRGYNHRTLESVFNDVQALRDLSTKIHLQRNGQPLNFPSPYQSRSADAKAKQKQKAGYLKEEPEATYDFETARNKLNEILKFTGPTRSVRPSNLGKDIKIGIAGCFHCPHHSEKNLIEGVEWMKSQGVNLFIVAGDLIDALSVTHAGFKKNIRAHQYVSLKDELAQAKAVLDYLSGSFDSVIVLRGNHPDRVRKWITERLGPELLWIVQHNMNILSLIVKDFSNVTLHELYDQNESDISWVYQIGDLRVCHAELGSSIEGRSTVALDQLFQEWESTLAHILERPYNVLVECHTHSAAMFPLNNGSKYLIEAGCMCKEPQYGLEGRPRYKHPQQNAMTYMVQHDGITDFNSIRMYVFKGMQ